MAKNKVPHVFRDILALDFKGQNRPHDKLIMFCLAAEHDIALGCTPLINKDFADKIGIARNTFKSRIEILAQDGLVKILEGEATKQNKHVRYVQVMIGQKTDRERRQQNQRMMFNHFWLQYPRKSAKQLAIKAWEKLNPTEDLAIRIMHDVGERQFYEWSRNDPKFIPYAATYINQRRWEDELDKSAGDNPTDGDSVLW